MATGSASSGKSRPPPGEEFSALLLDAAVDGIVLIDHKGTMRVFNQAAERLFGYQATEVLGANVSILMPEADAKAHDDYIARYLRTGEAKVIGRGREVLARRKDGTTFPAFLSVGRVPDSQPARFVGFIQDLTVHYGTQEQSRRLQERLWHVARFATMGEMATGIAHELNQPLAAIANYAQACDRLLASPDADIPEIREALREVTAQAVRAGDIIRRLRSLASRSDGAPRPTDINALVAELTTLVRTSAKADAVRYDLDLAASLPTVHAQPEQIQQVIASLVRNAIESLATSSSADRQITVKTRLGGGGDVELSVCDNGPGVAAAMIPRLFDAFYTSKDTGTGLGLAMSRTIIRRHGGSLEYRPNTPSGACFTVRLPASSVP